MNIGVFDSSLGGLSVLKELYKKLPDYNYVYLGDNAHVPYGNKSPELIYELTKQSVDFLFKKNCALVILACNTSTTNALRRLQREYLPQKYPSRRILGVVKPAVETIAVLQSKCVGVIGTRATISSGAFEREIRKVLPESTVVQNECPLLVPIIEEGEFEWDGLKSILEKYLYPLIKRNIDTLLLGCTHYSLIEKQIRNVLGEGITIVSEAVVIPEKLKNYFENHPEIEKLIKKNQKREYYVSDFSEQYNVLVKLFLGRYFGEKDLLQVAHL